MLIFIYWISFISFVYINMDSTFSNKYTEIINKLKPELDKLTAELTAIYKLIGDKTVEIIKLANIAYVYVANQKRFYIYFSIS